MCVVDNVYIYNTHIFQSSQCDNLKINYLNAYRKVVFEICKLSIINNVISENFQFFFWFFYMHAAPLQRPMTLITKCHRYQ